MASGKKPGLATHVKKPIDAQGAAAVADKLAGGSSTPSAPAASVSNEPHATQSYNLPIAQIELLADVATQRARAARRSRKGSGRVSASGVLREVIEGARAALEAELREGDD